MIPRTIHQTAKTHSLSWEEGRLLRRAQSLMPDWQFHLWDDADNKSLVKIVAPNLIAQYDAIGKGVVKADIARCLYMHKYGGFYIDTDYKVLAPFDDYLNNSCALPISRGINVSDRDFRLGNAVMGSSPGHPFWMSFVDHIFSRDISALQESMIEKTTGPEGLTQFYLTNIDQFHDIAVVPRKVFHPRITHRGLGVETGPETKGAHLCWGSWRTKSVLGNTKALLVRKATAL